MRRTIITRNRFTTFIQSLRGRVSANWRITPLWVFLFLVFISSCKDEEGIVGFKKDPRLLGEFIDIPLDPSVILDPGLLTDNPSGEQITRILFGRYNDPVFGSMEARGIVNFGPPPAFIKPSANATFDSLVIQLRFDYYYYGQTGSTQQKLQIFEVLDTIKYNKPYYASTPVAIASTPLAEKIFTISSDDFDNAIALNQDNDTTNNQIAVVRIKIPGILGVSLLNDFKIGSLDSIMENFNKFRGKYKGFAFVVPNGEGDKILGINPVFRAGNPKVTDTKISLYYTDDGIKSKADFVMYQAVNGTTQQFNSVLSYSKITTDRGATMLSGIVPFKDFRPFDGRFYIQSGTSLVTKLDLKHFYEFIDTVNNLAFNQAELIINNVSTGKNPSSLNLRVLDSTNHFRNSLLDTLQNKGATKTLDPYWSKTRNAFATSQSVTNTTVSVITDTNSDARIATDTRVINNIYLTSFCQQVYRYKTDKRRPTALAISASGDELRKSVSGLVLDQNIKLRIYYSKPVVKIR